MKIERSMGKHRSPIYEYLKSEGFDVTEERHAKIKELEQDYANAKYKQVEYIVECTNNAMNKIRNIAKFGMTKQRKKEKRVEMAKESLEEIEANQKILAEEMAKNIFAEL